MKTALLKKQSRLETRLSMTILALLAITAGGVYLRQFTVNPAVIAQRPDALRETHWPTADRAPLIDAMAGGFAPMSPPERFTPDTLYEKIDGRAELYLAAGFVSLDVQRFSAADAAGNWVEVFIYDMGTAENAFSVYGRQRRDGARPDDVGPNAYRTENALFVALGRYYLELIASDTAASLQDAMGILARAFADAHGSATAATSPGGNMFPAEAFVAGSLQLVTSDAFGYEPLDRVYTAQYRIDGSRLTAFVSDRSSTDAARALAQTYTQLLLSYGASTVDADLGIPGAALIQFFDTYDIVFSQGIFMAGVHEAQDREAAASLARRLAAHLASRTDSGRQ